MGLGGGGGGLWLSEFLAVDLSLWFSFLFVPAWQHFCAFLCACLLVCVTLSAFHWGGRGRG